MEKHHAVIKRNEIWIHAATWIHLERLVKKTKCNKTVHFINIYNLMFIVSPYLYVIHFV